MQLKQESIIMAQKYNNLIALGLSTPVSALYPTIVQSCDTLSNKGILLSSIGTLPLAVLGNIFRHTEKSGKIFTYQLQKPGRIFFRVALPTLMAIPFICGAAGYNMYKVGHNLNNFFSRDVKLGPVNEETFYEEVVLKGTIFPELFGLK